MSAYDGAKVRISCEIARNFALKAYFCMENKTLIHAKHTIGRFLPQL